MQTQIHNTVSYTLYITLGLYTLYLTPGLCVYNYWVYAHLNVTEFALRDLKYPFCSSPSPMLPTWLSCNITQFGHLLHFVFALSTAL